MCNCVTETNNALESHGLRLVTNIRLDRNTGNMSVVLPVAVERINPKDRKTKLIPVLGNYCPFCGKAKLVTGSTKPIGRKG